jgi:hypothetical protein
MAYLVGGKLFSGGRNPALELLEAGENCSSEIIERRATFVEA